MQVNSDLKSARLKRKENIKFFKKLKRIKTKSLDKLMHPIHEKVFSCTDCLSCANCCKTTGPLFTDKDITIVSKHLRIKPSEFTDKFLQIDEDKDYVLNSLPCVFLADDNSCTIYDHRPKACREFPHTDRIKQHQLLNITQKNIEICPAVYNIVEVLKKDLNL